VRIPSVRGEIRDRNGLTLVGNRASYEVDFYLPDMVRGYRQNFGKPPMATYTAPVKQMLKEKKEREAEARRKLEKEEAAERAAKQKREAERNTFLAKSLSDVEGLSTAAINRLAAADINTLWDLKNTSLKKIDDIPRIGNVLISEIKDYKTKHNL
jgi:cell division protein FtsI/penicillin-binding protein 2